MSESHIGGFHRPVQKLVDSSISFCVLRSKKKCKRILPPLPSSKRTPQSFALCGVLLRMALSGYQAAWSRAWLAV